MKRRLAALACAPDVSVAKIALAHGLNANLLFRWRRQYRAGHFGAGESPTDTMGACQPETVKFVPVVSATLAAKANSTKTGSVPVIEIVLGNATVRLCGSVDASALRAVLHCLASIR